MYQRQCRRHLSGDYNAVARRLAITPATTTHPPTRPLGRHHPSPRLLRVIPPTPVRKARRSVTLLRVHLRATPLPRARGRTPVGVRPYANPIGPVASANIQLERGQSSGQYWSFPAGSFDPNCGSLAWTVSGLPSGVTGTYSPPTTAPTGTTLLTIAAAANAAFGVATISITATCTNTNLSGPSTGGTTQTVGIYDITDLARATAGTRSRARRPRFRGRSTAAVDVLREDRR